MLLYADDLCAKDLAGSIEFAVFGAISAAFRLPARKLLNRLDRGEVVRT